MTRTVIAKLCILNMLLTAIVFHNGCARWSQTNQYLEIKNLSNEKILFTRRVSSGDRFFIRYTHSLTKRPIEESFEINTEGRIYLYETTFDAIGFGGPQPRMDDQWSIVGDKIIISNIHKPVGEILLRVSFLHSHLFVLNKDTLDLRMISDPGDLIRIKIYSH